MVRVDVVGVPVELEVVDDAEQLLPSVRVDRLHRRPLPPQVEVGLEALDANGVLHDPLVLVHRRRVRRDLQSALWGDVEHPQHRRELRLIALGVKPDSQRHLVGRGRRAVGVVVDLEADLPVGLQQLPGPLLIFLTHLAERPLGQQSANALLLHRGRQEVVRDPTPQRIGGQYLHRTDPAVGLQPRLGSRSPPLVVSVGGDVERVGLDHEIGRPELREHQEVLARGPLDRRRQVGRITLRGACVYPLHDGRDLLFGQRPVILEVLDADMRVHVPGRHEPLGHFVADAPCIAPSV